MRLENEEKRDFYIDECIKSNWSTRQLERQINSFYTDGKKASISIANGKLLEGKLNFTNGETKVFDMKPYLKYPIFKPLNNENEFKMFSIVDGTIEWNCDAELSTDTFYLGSKKYNKEKLKEM